MIGGGPSLGSMPSCAHNAAMRPGRFFPLKPRRGRPPLWQVALRVGCAARSLGPRNAFISDGMLGAVRGGTVVSRMLPHVLLSRSPLPALMPKEDRPTTLLDLRVQGHPLPAPAVIVCAP